MSLKTPLLTFDFEKQPFDGDPRQAHQFIPVLLGKLGASQLSYILNVQQYPDPQITEYALLKEQEHASDQAIAAVEFKEAMDTYTHQMLARELEINHIRRTVADPQERANQISAKIAPTMPKLRDVAPLAPQLTISAKRANSFANTTLPPIKPCKSSSPSYHRVYSTCAHPFFTMPPTLRARNC